MELRMKQRFFSVRQTLKVYDENKACVYTIRGGLVTPGKQIRICDSSGVEQIYIRQKILSPVNMPTYEFLVGDHTVATVVKDYKAFNRFTFEGLNWEMKGDMCGRNYQVLDGEKVIMTASTKGWFVKTYTLTLADDANIAVCLACAVVMDCVYHDSDASCGCINLRG